MHVIERVSAASPVLPGNPAVFALDDWPPGDRAKTGSRQVRMHKAYRGYARRAAVPQGVIFLAADVAKRARWTCAVCVEPVPRQWTDGQRDQAPALTFAVAWADGGRYDEAYARLAHFGCVVFPDAGLRRRVGSLLVRDLAVKAHAARLDETCPRGHALAGANLLKARDGRRRCRQCRNDRDRAARALRHHAQQGLRGFSCAACSGGS
jgi:hypothetical protein